MTAARPELPPELAAEVAASVRTLAAEAIRQALLDVALGTDMNEDEQALLQRYRNASEQHRIAALRTLERGAQPQQGQST